MPFTDSEQQEHRAAFVRECRQKAWGAACHAEWIGKQLDDLTARYQQLQEEDRGLEAEIKALETAIDYHSVESRQKRKDLQERRNGLSGTMQTLAANIRQGQQAMQQLVTSVESNLELAKHAEGWGWNEERSDDSLDT